MTGYTAFHTFPKHDALRAALVEREIPATLYQDGTSGGLLCVRVNLTDSDDEYAPHVLISTEEVVDTHGNIEWTGCLYGVGVSEGYDVTLRGLERPGLFDSLADEFVPYLRLLIAGSRAIDVSSSASRQHFIDTGRYLLLGEAYSV